MAHGFRPRRGGLAFYPRKKAKRIYPKINTYKASDVTKPVAFAGYKAGMTHVIAMDTYEKSPSYGQKIAVPVTIIECPPLFVFGVKAYQKEFAVSQIYAEKLDKDLARALRIPKKNKGSKKKIEAALKEITEIRLLTHSQPKKIRLKKTPEVLEIPLSGKSIDEAWKYAQEKLGKEIKITEILEDGAYIDVIAVSKGKGTQGPVKRFHVKIQIRKNHGHRRFPGAIGSWNPHHVLHTVAQAGQMGFQRRTEYNKRILKISEKPEELKIAGGIPHYGEINSEYALVQGSVPGSKKRFVILRPAMRILKTRPKLEINKISIETQMR